MVLGPLKYILCTVGVNNDSALFLFRRESPRTSQGTVVWRTPSWLRDSWIQRCLVMYLSLPSHVRVRIAGFKELPPLQNLSAYNTRLFKKKSEGKASYEVRLASAVQKGERAFSFFLKAMLIKICYK